MHVPTNALVRGEPVVCAGNNWSFVAWVDYQNMLGYPQIFGCAHTPTGALQPGSNLNGVLISSLTQEATQPDLATPAAVGNSAMIVYETDPGTAAPAFPRTIEGKLVDATTSGISAAVSLQMGGLTVAPPFTSTDADKSLVGFQQRRPRLLPLGSSA
jgi:hypothetical protein